MFLCPRRGTTPHRQSLLAMLSYPAKLPGGVFYAWDGTHAACSEGGTLDLFPTRWLHWQHQPGGLCTNVGLGLSVERHHRQTSRHTLKQRQTEAFVAKREQDVSLAVPVHDATGRLVRIDDLDAQIIRHIALKLQAGLNNQAGIWIVSEGQLPRRYRLADVLAWCQHANDQRGKARTCRTFLIMIDLWIDPFVGDLNGHRNA